MEALFSSALLTNKQPFAGRKNFLSAFHIFIILAANDVYRSQSYKINFVLKGTKLNLNLFDAALLQLNIEYEHYLK